MTNALSLHVLRRADLEAATIYAGWEDGERLARPSSIKRALMLENPMSQGLDEPMQVIGLKGQRVIGRIDLIAGRIVTGEHQSPILWGSEFFVPEEDRSTMMGAMLLLRCQQIFHTIGAHGPSQMAYPLYAKLKWIDVPYQRYVVIFRSKPVVRRYVRVPAAASVAAGLSDAALLGHKAYLGLRRGFAASGLSAREVPAMPAELDAPLRRQSPLVRGYRGVDWINWSLKHHFSDASRHERRLFLVHAKGATDPIAYFMLKIKFLPVATSRAFPDLTLCSLVDAICFDESRCSREALVHLALREAGRLNVDALELSDRPGNRTSFYRGIGALPAGTMHLMVRAVNPSPIADASFRDPAKWDFQLGDGEYIPN